jgi:mRNA interferase MazF
VTRGDVWFAEAGRKRRPVLVLTRAEVIDVRALVTVAEITTSIRNIAAEVDFDHDEAGLDRPSVINCDGLHTITKASLTTYAGSVSEETMERVCAAVAYGLGC